MIEVSKISYSIGDTVILGNISFQVLPGELLVVLGSNGAGKSTLLKLMCGDLQPVEGNITLHGRNLSGWPHSELATFRAVLQQHSSLSLPFSVSEVVMMGRYPHQKSRETDADRQIVQEALKKTGIAHLASRNYLHLSGGEQQRVHLARVFAQVWTAGGRALRYLFMDEPVNSLDIRHQHATLEIAREFAAEGNAVVAVLHDLNLAIQYADKILLLKKGRIAAFGAPEEVMQQHIISSAYDHPLSIFHTPHYKHPIVVPVLKA